MCNIDENEVREMAYYHWLSAGSPEGRDLEFWFAAEDEWWEMVYRSWRETTKKRESPEEAYWKVIWQDAVSVEELLKKAGKII